MFISVIGNPLEVGILLNWAKMVFLELAFFVFVFAIADPGNKPNFQRARKLN